MHAVRQERLGDVRLHSGMPAPAPVGRAQLILPEIRVSSAIQPALFRLSRISTENSVNFAQLQCQDCVRAERNERPGPVAGWIYGRAMGLHQCSIADSVYCIQGLPYSWMGAWYDVLVCILILVLVISK